MLKPFSSVCCLVCIVGSVICYVVGDTNGVVLTCMFAIVTSILSLEN